MMRNWIVLACLVTGLMCSSCRDTEREESHTGNRTPREPATAQVLPSVGASGTAPTVQQVNQVSDDQITEKASDVLADNEVNTPEVKSVPAPMPETPEDLIQRLAWAIENADDYQPHPFLTAEEIEKHVPNWEQHLPSKIEIVERTYLSLLVEQEREFKLPGGTTARLVEGAYDEIHVIQTDRDGTRHGSRLPDEALDKYDYEFPYALRLTHPANKVVHHYNIRNHPVSTVVEQLCSTGYMCFAFPTEAEGSRRISVDIRHKTVTQCLDYAAHAAGLRPSYWISVDNPDVPLGESMVRISELPAWTYEIRPGIAEEIAKLIESRKSNPPTDAELANKAIELLNKHFLHEAKQWVERREVVFMLVQPEQEALTGES